MAKIISPPTENSKQIEKVYWPETTIPYGEDTAFAAAKVYAGAITGWQEIFQKKNALLRRAAELLDKRWTMQDWDEKYEQWLSDAGMDEK